jgi:hypothetical protein
MPVVPIKKPDDEDDMGEFTEAKYDKWSGYESNLFANSEYDDEDRDEPEDAFVSCLSFTLIGSGFRSSCLL